MQEEAWQAGMRHGRCVQLVVRSHERWYHGDMARTTESEATQAAADAAAILDRHSATGAKVSATARCQPRPHGSQTSAGRTQITIG
jgi:hypothetical protein